MPLPTVKPLDGGRNGFHHSPSISAFAVLMENLIPSALYIHGGALPACAELQERRHSSKHWRSASSNTAISLSMRVFFLLLIIRRFSLSSEPSACAGSWLTVGAHALRFLRLGSPLVRDIRRMPVGAVSEMLTVTPSEAERAALAASAGAVLFVGEVRVGPRRRARISVRRRGGDEHGSADAANQTPHSCVFALSGVR